MDKYVLLLALTYFKEKGENYQINELMQIIGYNRNQTDDLISTMIDKGYIEYQLDLLSISGKGLAKLIAENQDEMVLCADNIGPKHIQPEKGVSYEVPYVPVNFQAKIDERYGQQ